MSDEIAKIEIYPGYNKDGSMNLDLPFYYSCVQLDLMGYTDLLELEQDIRRRKLQE